MEAHLANHQALDAIPQEARWQVEEHVRQVDQVECVNADAFRMACAALTGEWRPYFDFLAVFVRRAPGIKQGDHAFVYDWLRPFAKLKATYAELMEVFELWLTDPRRDQPRWEGKWPKDALRHLIKHIRQIRKLRDFRSPQAGRDPVKSEELFVESQPSQVEPLPFATDPVCIAIGAALLARIGQKRFDDWFVGKTRLERSEDGFRVGVKKRMSDFYRTTFSADLRAAVDEVQPGAKVCFYE